MLRCFLQCIIYQCIICWVIRVAACPGTACFVSYPIPDELVISGSDPALNAQKATWRVFAYKRLPESEVLGWIQTREPWLWGHHMLFHLKKTKPILVLLPRRKSRGKWSYTRTSTGPMLQSPTWCGENTGTFHCCIYFSKRCDIQSKLHPVSVNLWICDRGATICKFHPPAPTVLLSYCLFSKRSKWVSTMSGDNAKLNLGFHLQYIGPKVLEALPERLYSVSQYLTHGPHAPLPFLSLAAKISNATNHQ